MKKLALAVVFIFTGAANSSDGQAQQQLPGISVEKKGNFQIIQTIDPNLAKQAQNFATLRKISGDQNTILVPWLIANSLDLPPPFLLETARRLWEMDRRNEAFEWYALALVRTKYDAGRCIDPTTRQIILPPIAANVVLGIDQFRSEFGEAGLRAVARADAFSSRVSPWWACSQGMVAIKAGLENKSIEESAWLQPRSGWDALQATITREFTTFFNEQGKPQDDPIPKSKTAYSVTTVGVAEYGDFAWLDAQRLIFAERKIDIQKRWTNILRMWKEGSPTEEIASFPGAWCAGNDMVSYVLNVETKPGSERVTTLVSGEFRKATESTLVSEDSLFFADLMHRGFRQFSSDPRRQSPFDCRWVKNETLSGGRRDSEWLPLLPGDGFLAFVKSEPSAAKKILYYSDEKSIPLELPDVRGVEAGSVSYYAYKNAYFLSLAKSPRSEQLNCAVAWWFYPRDNRTEQVCGPLDEITKNSPSYWPSRAGLLRAISARRTPHGEKPGGIYLTLEDGKSEKIFEGNVFFMSVSPDGCKVAVKLYPMNLGDIKVPLSVMDLCSGMQSPNAAAK